MTTSLSIHNVTKIQVREVHTLSSGGRYQVVNLSTDRESYEINLFFEEIPIIEGHFGRIRELHEQPEA